MAKAKVEKLNIYQKIMKARKMFQECEVKKSGKNDFQGFVYLELEDIVPPAIEICEELGLYSEVQPNGSDALGFATMKIINVDNPEEQVVYKIRSPTVNPDSAINSKLQDTGRIQTYLRRYLYMLFLDIAVPDEVDSKPSDGSKKTGVTTRKTATKKTTKKITPKKATKRATTKKTAKKSETDKTIKDLEEELSDERLDELAKESENFDKCILKIKEKGNKPTNQLILAEITEMFENRDITITERNKLRKKLIE